MAKTSSVYFCNECGYTSVQWLGRCPDCGLFNTLVEQIETSRSLNGFIELKTTPAIRITEVSSVDFKRQPTNISEIDRVLGGGIVPGSLILIGGTPGIGKSTILLQVSASIANQGKRVLVVSGEESAQQVKLRAERTSALNQNTYLQAETNVVAIEKQIESLRPDVLIIDSIQTMYFPQSSSAPGSVSQVRECTARFLNIAKNLGITTFLVGHVTKEGSIAGPRVLEHMVDTVLYFEGNNHHTHRMIRVVKNRYGSTNEVGVFEMRDNGLFEVKNPSQLFLAERINEPGSVVSCTAEGTRTLLLEVQSLVSSTNFTNPRRQTSGVDNNRLSIILAVLEKRAGLSLADKDVYANVAGGLKVTEAGADLAIAFAVASSLKNCRLPADTVVFGEIGLSGEVRQVAFAEQRILEASKLGFYNVIGPKKGKIKIPKNITYHPVSKIEEALEYLAQR
jgi:DNA repair protein RadA/Sms